MLLIEELTCESQELVFSLSRPGKAIEICKEMAGIIKKHGIMWTVTLCNVISVHVR